MRIFFASVLVLLLCAMGAQAATAQDGQTRYSLANGCYALHTGGGTVVPFAGSRL